MGTCPLSTPLLQIKVYFFRQNVKNTNKCPKKLFHSTKKSVLSPLVQGLMKYLLKKSEKEDFFLIFLCPKWAERGGVRAFACSLKSEFFYALPKDQRKTSQKFSVAYIYIFPIDNPISIIFYNMNLGYFKG